MLVNLKVPNGIDQLSIPNEKSKNDDGVTNNKTAADIGKDNANASETDVVGFHKREKRETSSDDLTTFSSSISNLTDFSNIDYSSYNSTVQRNSLEKSYSFNATEEESDADEAIRDEDFSFLTDYDREKIDDCSNFTGNCGESEENVFESRPPDNDGPRQSTDRPNSDNMLSGIIEKSSLANIIGNRSDIEEEMIIMFNREINAFPDYRSHAAGVETTSRTTHHGGEIINSATELVL